MIYKVKCICGHVHLPPVKVREISLADLDEDLDSLKTALDDGDYTEEGIHKVVDLDLDLYPEDHEEVTQITCPACGTVSQLVVCAYIAGDELKVSSKAEDKLITRYPSPVNQTENYVYSHALSRQNGRQTLQCSVTKKIKFLD